MATAGVGTVFAVLPLWLVGIPVWASAAVTLLVVGLLGWLIHAAGQLATVADLKGIEIRGYFGRRRIAWEDIQTIEAAPNPGALTQNDAPSMIVYVYSRDGKRRLLPYVDDIHVNLAREYQLLHEIWEELRGREWAPDADAAVHIARSQARHTALMFGMVCSMLSFIPLMVVALLPLFVDFPEWAEPVMNPFVVMGAGLPAVFAVTALLSYRKNRKNRPAG
ncbi:PH domain-containing protein [Streptomyces sp. GMY02]|uniref:PH domain-containing protein n=1 Tax=Streptomyces sp. GMY02 TaxID=1333528 RepID=UPI001C2C44C5|nr:PH domain-containing protein [Streptomyces sp. GMY02]QXE37062.1 PH domain-containing protein [Streptomyces sp. GMY02]